MVECVGKRVHASSNVTSDSVKAESMKAPNPVQRFVINFLVNTSG
jgi:hypothetical protein